MTMRSRRGDLELSRRLVQRRDALIGLDQEFAGTDTRTVVTHDFFLLTRISVHEGTLSFPIASGEVVAPERCLLLIPSRSVLPMRFANAIVSSSGFAARGPAPGLVPALLPTDTDEGPIDAATCRLLLGDPHHQLLDPDRAVPEYVSAARALLHAKLGRWAPVAHAAQRVGVSPETLARAFQAAYHVGPKGYSNRARLFQSVLSLLDGRNIINAAFEAGFGDLKRFYAQFGTAIGATPGEYARIRKRQDRLEESR